MRYFLIFLSCLAATATAADNVELIRESMEKANLGAKVEFIEPSAMPGLYVIGLKGGRVLYASDDGQFFIQGRLYKAGNGRTVNLTDEQERQGIAKAISDVAESEMIVFKAEDERSLITVFTDTSCPFCHKLHEDIDDINDSGVTVRYLAYPRQGLKSKAYETMVSVWCSDKRQQAFSDAIDDDEVIEATCDDPVKRHYQLGQQIGIQGTPTLVFQNGTMVSGYRTPEQIKMISDAMRKEK